MSFQLGGNHRYPGRHSMDRCQSHITLVNNKQNEFMMIPGQGFMPPGHLDHNPSFGFGPRLCGDGDRHNQHGCREAECLRRTQGPFLNQNASMYTRPPPGFPPSRIIPNSPGPRPMPFDPRFVAHTPMPRTFMPNPRFFPVPNPRLRPPSPRNPCLGMGLGPMRPENSPMPNQCWPLPLPQEDIMPVNNMPMPIPMPRFRPPFPGFPAAAMNQNFNLAPPPPPPPPPPHHQQPNIMHGWALQNNGLKYYSNDMNESHNRGPPFRSPYRGNQFPGDGDGFWAPGPQAHEPWHSLGGRLNEHPLVNGREPYFDRINNVQSPSRSRSRSQVKSAFPSVSPKTLDPKTSISDALCDSGTGLLVHEGGNCSANPAEDATLKQEIPSADSARLDWEADEKTKTEKIVKLQMGLDSEDPAEEEKEEATHKSCDLAPQPKPLRRPGYEVEQKETLQSITFGDTRAESKVKQKRERIGSDESSSSVIYHRTCRVESNSSSGYSSSCPTQPDETNSDVLNSETEYTVFEDPSPEASEASDGECKLFIQVSAENVSNEAGQGEERKKFSKSYWRKQRRLRLKERLQAEKLLQEADPDYVPEDRSVAKVPKESKVKVDHALSCPLNNELKDPERPAVSSGLSRYWARVLKEAHSDHRKQRHRASDHTHQVSTQKRSGERTASYSDEGQGGISHQTTCHAVSQENIPSRPASSRADSFSDITATDSTHQTTYHALLQEILPSSSCEAKTTSISDEGQRGSTLEYVYQENILSSSGSSKIESSCDESQGGTAHQSTCNDVPEDGSNPDTVLYKSEDNASPFGDSPVADPTCHTVAKDDTPIDTALSGVSQDDTDSLDANHLRSGSVRVRANWSSGESLQQRSNRLQRPLQEDTHYNSYTTSSSDNSHQEDKALRSVLMQEDSHKENCLIETDSLNCLFNSTVPQQDYHTTKHSLTSGVLFSDNNHDCNILVTEIQTETVECPSFYLPESSQENRPLMDPCSPQARFQILCNGLNKMDSPEIGQEQVIKKRRRRRRKAKTSTQLDKLDDSEKCDIGSNGIISNSSDCGTKGILRASSGPMLTFTDERQYNVTGPLCDDLIIPDRGLLQGYLSPDSDTDKNYGVNGNVLSPGCSPTQEPQGEETADGPGKRKRRRRRTRKKVTIEEAVPTEERSEETLDVDCSPTTSEIALSDAMSRSASAERLRLCSSPDFVYDPSIASQIPYYFNEPDIEEEFPEFDLSLSLSALDFKDVDDDDTDSSFSWEGFDDLPSSPDFSVDSSNDSLQNEPKVEALDHTVSFSLGPDSKENEDSYDYEDAVQQEPSTTEVCNSSFREEEQSECGTTMSSEGLSDDSEIDYDSFLPAHVLMHVKRDLVSVLMEYGQTREVKVTFQDMERSGPHHASRFHTAAVVDNEVFPVGTGSSKKNAKKAAAAHALKIMYERGKKNLEIVNELAHKKLRTMTEEEVGSHAHRVVLVSRHVLDTAEETQFINYSKDKIAATFVLEYHGKMRVVGLGTGNRCILFQHMTTDGKRILHSHAEIIAKRAFHRYLFKQLLVYNGNRSHPIFTRSDTGKLKLKDRIQVHLYISRPPCGDAAAFPTISNFPNKMRAIRKQGQLRTIIDDGEGAIPTDFPVPAGANGKERLRIMTCSDKICRWNVLGVQGALLSHFLDPIYLTSVVIGSHTGDQRGHVPRAVSGRLKCGRLHEVIQRPYRINTPDIHYPHDDLADCYNITKSKQYCITWSYGDPDAEVIDAITGLTNMEAQDEPVPSRVSKAELASLFAQVCQRYGLDDIAKQDYTKAKKSATTFQRMKSFVGQHLAAMGFGQWYSLQATYGTDNFCPGQC